VIGSGHRTADTDTDGTGDVRTHGHGWPPCAKWRIVKARRLGFDESRPLKRTRCHRHRTDASRRSLAAHFAGTHRTTSPWEAV
jgi:hypothetical protein